MHHHNFPRSPLNFLLNDEDCTTVHLTGEFQDMLDNYNTASWDNNNPSGETRYDDPVDVISNDIMTTQTLTGHVFPPVTPRSTTTTNTHDNHPQFFIEPPSERILTRQTLRQLVSSPPSRKMSKSKANQMSILDQVAREGLVVRQVDLNDVSTLTSLSVYDSAASKKQQDNKRAITFKEETDESEDEDKEESEDSEEDEDEVETVDEDEVETVDEDEVETVDEDEAETTAVVDDDEAEIEEQVKKVVAVKEATEARDDIIMDDDQDDGEEEYAIVEAEDDYVPLQIDDDDEEDVHSPSEDDEEDDNEGDEDYEAPTSRKRQQPSRRSSRRGGKRHKTRRVTRQTPESSEEDDEELPVMKTVTNRQSLPQLGGRRNQSRNIRGVSKRQSETIVSQVAFPTLDLNIGLRWAHQHFTMLKKRLFESNQVLVWPTSSFDEFLRNPKFKTNGEYYRILCRETDTDVRYIFTALYEPSFVLGNDVVKPEKWVLFYIDLQHGAAGFVSPFMYEGEHKEELENRAKAIDAMLNINCTSTTRRITDIQYTDEEGKVDLDSFEYGSEAFVMECVQFILTPSPYRNHNDPILPMLAEFAMKNCLAFYNDRAAKMKKWQAKICKV